MSSRVYPLPGAPLLPGVLADALGDEPVSTRVRRTCGLHADARLGMLDASIWHRHPMDYVSLLASEVVQTTRRRWSAVTSLVAPVSAASSTVHELAEQVSPRARNLLLRAPDLSGARTVRSLTVGQLAAVENLGAQLLLEILVTAENLTEGDSRAYAEGLQARSDEPAQHGKPSRAVGRLATQVGRARWSSIVCAGDPRFGDLVRRVDPMATTAGEAALLAAERPVTPGEARRLAHALRELADQVAHSRRLALRDELSAVVEAIIPAASAQRMVISRLGLGDEAAMTLQQAGDRAGVTRERVRQVEKRFRDSVAANPPWTPVLDKTIRSLREQAPGRLSDSWAELRDRGVVDDLLYPKTLVAAARAFGKHTGIVIDPDHDLVLADDVDPELESMIRTRARSLITHWGATTVDEIRAVLENEGHQVPDPLARLLLQRLDGFSWLDEMSGWFWLRTSGRSRLLNQIEKIMSIAGSITISELRDGVGRHHRMKGFRPPREVLAVLCEQTGLYRRDGDTIIGGPDLPDWKDILGTNEATIADVLFRHGPIMRRDELEQRAVDEGQLNRSSFYVYLGYSPILERYAPSVYGLRGAQVSAAQVDSLIPPRARTQVLQDHGWTDNGDIWIAYRVSAAGERSGVVTTPGALKGVVHGDYQLFAEDARTVGTLVVEDSMWGLSPFFRRFGVEQGDYLVIQISLRERRATIHAGAADLLLRFQQGE